MNRRAAAQAASHIILRIALFALLAGFGAGSAKLYAESAKSCYKRGQAAEAREDYDAAFIDYQKAYSISPKDMSYRKLITGCRSLRPRCI